MIIRDNCQFCTETFVVTLYLNRLNETVQTQGSQHKVSVNNINLEL